MADERQWSQRQYLERSVKELDGFVSDDENSCAVTQLLTSRVAVISKLHYLGLCDALPSYLLYVFNKQRHIQTCIIMYQEVNVIIQSKHFFSSRRLSKNWDDMYGSTYSICSELEAGKLVQKINKKRKNII